MEFEFYRYGLRLRLATDPARRRTHDLIAASPNKRAPSEEIPLRPQDTIALGIILVPLLPFPTSLVRTGLCEYAPHFAYVRDTGCLTRRGSEP